MISSAAPLSTPARAWCRSGTDLRCRAVEDGLLLLRAQPGAGEHRLVNTHVAQVQGDVHANARRFQGRQHQAHDFHVRRQAVVAVQLGSQLDG